LSGSIYFAGSITGGRDDVELYRQIIRMLEEYGHVLTEHVGDPTLDAGGESRPTSGAIYRRDMAWLARADAVVAEVTIPSHGVGYEIATAEGMGKPVLCLFRPAAARRLSALLEGNPNARCESYDTLEEVRAILKRFFGGWLAE
jgi:nucleoside 2-deoxyribosyltransferase